MARSRQPGGSWQQTTVSAPVHLAPPLHEQSEPELHDSPNRQTSLIGHSHFPVPLLHVPLPPPLRQLLLSSQRQTSSPPRLAQIFPFWASHELLHTPQWVALREASQPSSAVGAAGVVQLTRPRSHTGSHTPSEQLTAVTLAPEQACPHAPQSVASVARSASQPSSAAGAAGREQLPSVPLQAEVQSPAAQVAPPVTPTFEQARPHPPQCAVVDWRFTSQPSSTEGAEGWPQLPHPAVQVESHAPAVQRRVAVLVDEQARPHAPQLATSAPPFSSQPSSAAGGAGWLQSSQGAEQSGAHSPPEHARVPTLAVEQLRPQAPQLSGSNWTFFSQPSSAAGAAGVEQSAHPVEHVGAHCPAEHHRAAVLVEEQTRPHAPQFDGSASTAISQPSSAAGGAGCEQLPYPGVQVDVHRPAAHAAVETFTVEQARPHPPQFAASVASAVSQPSSGDGAAGCSQLP